VAKVPANKAKGFESKLREHKESIESTAQSLREQGRDSQPLDSADLADKAVLSYQREMHFNQSTQGHSHLALIEKALGRIADGTYGDCVSCGKAIGLKRLEAIPWTPRCIDCQERIERGEVDDSGRAA
jgi:DnaK suppressor protein